MTEAATPWTTRTVDQGSGAGPREVEGWTDTAVGDHAGQPPVPLRWGLRRAPTGAGTPQAWWSTTLEQTPAPLRPGCVRRWTIAVTCEEARAHGRRATPRQGHERAMGRPTPVLWRRSSRITLTAQLLIHKGATGVRRLAWPPQTRPPCAEAMAWVRRHVWEHRSWAMSQQDIDLRHIPPTLVFTLWLSMITAEGAGSRPACRRTLRRKASWTRCQTPCRRHRRNVADTVCQGGSSRGS